MSLDDILTVTEVAALYHLSTQLVSRACNHGRLVVGKECVYKGSLWIITRQAADRLWGHRLLQAPPGMRVCRKCRAILPENRFVYFKTKSGEGMGYVCRDCRNLQCEAWRQKNKARLRPIRAAYARQYRASGKARSPRHYRLKRALKSVA